VIASKCSLRAWAERYAVDKGLALNSRKLHCYLLNVFERDLARPAMLADLNAEIVNGWLAARLEHGLDPDTVRTNRRCLLALWRGAVEAELMGQEPKGIRKIRVPTKLPQAWSLEELSRLLVVCRMLPGRMKRDRCVRRCDFWRAWVLAGYHTGFRLADLLALRSDQIAADGSIVVVQAKTGAPVHCQPAPEALAAIAALMSTGRKRIFGDLMCRRNVQETFAVLVKRAGLAGSTKRLRSSGATWIETMQPGSAMAFLGHKTPGLAYRSYVDLRFVQAHKPTPPPIG
jgi:integrase